MVEIRWGGCGIGAVSVEGGSQESESGVEQGQAASLWAVPLEKRYLGGFGDSERWRCRCGEVDGSVVRRKEK